MIVQLTGDWPCGNFVVPAGTTLNSDAWAYRGSALPLPPPINAMCCDQSAYDTLLEAGYPKNRILTIDGIDRHD